MGPYSRLAVQGKHARLAGDNYGESCGECHEEDMVCAHGCHCFLGVRRALSTAKVTEIIWNRSTRLLKLYLYIILEGTATEKQRELPSVSLLPI